MVSALRILAGAISTIGGTVVVSVPIVLHSNGSSRVRRNDGESSENSGGGVNQITINQCVEPISRDHKNIEFGSQESGNICWSSDLESGLLKVEEWSELFKEQWKDKERTWNNSENQSWWMPQCLNNKQHSQWAITANLGKDIQYLGLCGEADINQTKFVKKSKGIFPKDENWSISICGNNCWTLTEATIEGTLDTLETEKKENWKSVEFYVRGNPDSSLKL